MYVYAEARSWPLILHLIFWDRVPHWPGAQQSARLADQWAGVPTLQTFTSTSSFLCECWGPSLGPLACTQSLLLSLNQTFNKVKALFLRLPEPEHTRTHTSCDFVMVERNRNKFLQLAKTLGCQQSVRDSSGWSLYLSMHFHKNCHHVARWQVTRMGNTYIALASLTCVSPSNLERVKTTI